MAATRCASGEVPDTRPDTQPDDEESAMTSLRDRPNTALVVIDVQNDVVANAHQRDEVIGNISALVDKARDEHVPVIWVQHSDEELTYGSPAWQWAPELQPMDGETRIYKRFNSSFEETTLETELARLGATHIVLAGAATNWCIRATAYGALDRGYDLTLIEDAHTTGTMELDNGVRIEAANVIQELNVAMTWLSYPGRTNRTATAEAVEFATP